MSDYLDETPPIKKPEVEDRDYSEEESIKKWVRPWVRFWARMFDYSLLYLLVFFSAFYFRMPIYVAPWYLFPLFFTFVWVFIESFLLSTWGTTPGKWLLYTRVTIDGKKPTFRQALSRSLAVWWLGFGAGLPFVWIVTCIVANVKLSNTGSTTWDRTYKFDVEHKKLGFFRTFITVCYFVFYMAIFGRALPQ